MNSQPRMTDIEVVCLRKPGKLFLEKGTCSAQTAHPETTRNETARRRRALSMTVVASAAMVPDWLNGSSVSPSRSV